MTVDEETKDETKSPTPTPTPTLPPGSIVVSVEDWNRYRDAQSKLDQVERDKQAAIDAKERERLNAVGEKEGAVKALDEQRNTFEGKLTAAESRAQRAEQRELDASKASVITQAFAGRTFAGDSAEERSEKIADLKALLEDKYEASRDGNGVIVVKEKATGLPAKESLQSLLDGKRYANFFAPKGGSGTGGGNADRSGREEQKKEPEPGTLDWYANRRQKAREDSMSIGLFPKSRRA